jgi:hypothetical protein
VALLIAGCADREALNTLTPTASSASSVAATSSPSTPAASDLATSTCHRSSLEARFVGTGAGAGLLVAFIEVTNTGPISCTFGSEVHVDALFPATSREIGATDDTRLILRRGEAAAVGLRGQYRDYDHARDRCATSDWSTPAAWRLNWADQSLTLANVNRSVGNGNGGLGACKGEFFVVQTVSPAPPEPLDSQPPMTGDTGSSRPPLPAGYGH